MQCIVVKSDEFVLPYIIPLNPDYVAARSLRSLRSNNDITEHNTPPVNANGNNTQSAFWMGKPKMQKFSGDVRDFAIFKTDFKHLVEGRYSKRDSITILRSSLNGKPLELIKGIGHDYDAAWEHLESIFGAPRFVADISREISPNLSLCVTSREMKFQHPVGSWAAK